MRNDLKFRKEDKKSKIRIWILLGATLAIAALLLLSFPEERRAVINTIWNYFTEMMLILPAVMILLGLLEVWVPRDIVVRYLGESSGVKGVFLAIVLGALPSGPLYVAFPIAASLLNKGARVSNIIVFLSAWACIKMPQEMVELQFLGLRFMVTRLLLTIVFVIIMGFLIEQIIKWGNNKRGVSNAAY